MLAAQHSACSMLTALLITSLLIDFAVKIKSDCCPQMPELISGDERSTDDAGACCCLQQADNMYLSRRLVSHWLVDKHSMIVMMQHIESLETQPT